MYALSPQVETGTLKLRFPGWGVSSLKVRTLFYCSILSAYYEYLSKTNAEVKQPLTRRNTRILKPGWGYESKIFQKFWV